MIFAQSGAEVNEITFHSRSGPLHVTKVGSDLQLDFPAVPGEVCEPPSALVEALGVNPIKCLKAMDYLAVFEDEHTICSLRPDFTRLKELDLRGLIATAPGLVTDFVSRFFAPKYGVDEDPITGSAHGTLTPYWAERLVKLKLKARQLSRRTGRVDCELTGDRVLLAGRTRAYLEGFIEI